MNAKVGKGKKEKQLQQEVGQLIRLRKSEMIEVK